MMQSINLIKQKQPRKKRTAKSNGQKDYEKRNVKLFNLGTSPIHNSKGSSCKRRVQSKPMNVKKVDITSLKGIKVGAKYPRYNVRGKVDAFQNVTNIEDLK